MRRSFVFDESEEVSNLIASTARVFEFRFIHNYKKAMDIKFDIKAERGFVKDGFPNTKVFHIG